MFISNCPNCGAPIVGNKCEYCGTIFKDTQEKYQFSHEQENLYLRLDLLHKLDQLNIKKRDSEYQLAYDNFVADTKQIMNLVYNLK